MDFLKRVKTSDVVIAIAILAIVMLIIIPLNSVFMDLLLVVNITISLLILFITVYVKEALEFSTFPTVLLITTVFRLGLNLASTRLILGNGGDAGSVIRTFGSFVIGDNIVVGIIVFLIIVIIQFVVITKGAGRVAEVAARFTLDAMPGKQMAIDADLNSGIIDEDMAKERRKKVQHEADFYGAMDGASKFVKGDAVVGILITIVNIVGGLIIGALGIGGVVISTDEVVRVYTLATVGDGICSQLPALLISTATGIIVTRAGSDGALGGDLARQMFGKPLVLLITGSMLMFINLIPGLPKFPILMVGSTLIGVGIYQLRREPQAEAAVSPDNAAEQAANEKRKPESVTSLLSVDHIELEFGYGIIPLVDASQGGDLLDRVVMIRRQCAMDLGIIVPIIRLRDNIQLKTNEYCIKIRGVEIAKSEVMTDHFLALNTGGEEGEISGIDTIEPAFGLPALWVNERERERAELMGYTIIDPPSVIATHLTEIIKQHSFELLDRQQVHTLVENIAKTQPSLVEEVVPKLVSFGDLQKVLANLLRENVSIRDMATILETLGNFAMLTRDSDVLTEYVRQNLRRMITRRFIPDNKAHVMTLDPALEQLIGERLKQSESGSYVALDPQHIQGIYTSLKNVVERMMQKGQTPIVLTAPGIRRHFKKISEQMINQLIVLSFNELEQDVDIISEGMVSF